MRKEVSSDVHFEERTFPHGLRLAREFEVKDQLNENSHAKLSLAFTRDRCSLKVPVDNTRVSA